MMARKPRNVRVPQWPRARSPLDPPTPYYVGYDDDDLFRTCVAKHGEDETCNNPDWFRETRDFETVDEARVFAQTVQGATVYHRINIYDDTPPEVTWERWWFWDSEVVE